MRKIIITSVALLIAAGLLFAQAGQYSEQSPTGPVTSCPAPVAGSNILCSVTDGYYQSNNGSAYQKLAAGTITTGIVGGTCPSGQYMNGISAAGVPSCAVLPAVAAPAAMSCTGATAAGTILATATGGMTLSAVKLSGCQ